MTQSTLNFEQDICANNHGGNPQSDAAHSITADSAPILRRQILERIKEIPSTCDEVEVALSLPHQTVSARISELKRDGFIVADGTRLTRTATKAAIYHSTDL